MLKKAVQQGRSEQLKRFSEFVCLYRPLDGPDVSPTARSFPIPRF